MSAPIAAFVGTTPNIGTTTAAFAAACRMAERTGKEVGFLCLNLKSAKIHRYLGLDIPPVTLDSLRPELSSASLTPQRLLRACISVPDEPKVHVLAGNLLRDQAEHYTMEETEHLLDAARQSFDFVFADGGCYWDNAATIGAVRAADSRVLCTTPALSHFQEDGNRWIRQISPLFGVQPEQYELLVVQSNWMNGGYRMKEIEKEVGLAAIGEFRMNESFYRSLDRGQYHRWLKQDADGRVAMDMATDKLAARHGLTCKPVMKSQPWYRKLKAHRGELGV